MKKEQAAFAERLSAALAAAKIEASPVELEKLLARYGGMSVTPQAISGWLSGKHLPKQANMRALARMVNMEPYVLQYGGKSGHAVREVRTAWPDDLSGKDRLAFEEFRTLPDAHRELVRKLITALADRSSRRKPA